MKVEKILRIRAGVLLPVTDFQNFFTVKWNVVLTLAYNKRSCVDLTLLFCRRKNYLSEERLESSLKKETTGESTAFIRSIDGYDTEMHTRDFQ